MPTDTVNGWIFVPSDDPGCNHSVNIFCTLMFNHMVISDILYENCQLSEIGTYIKKKSKEKVANIGLSVLKSSRISESF